MLTCLVVCAWATLFQVVAEALHAKLARAVTKVLASSAFVAAALVGGSWVGPIGRWMTLALLLSWLGDVLLLSHEKRPFLAGIGAFLLAHLAFAGAFIGVGVDVATTAKAAIPMLGLGAAVFWVLRERAGTLAGPVLAYILAIVVMVSLSFGAADASHRWDLPIAATLFFISDLCVARDRFVRPQWGNKVIGLPLYYGAQIMFAAAAGTLG